MPGSSEPSRSASFPLLLAAAFGLVHAGFSAYWGLGGSWLLDTLGSIVDAFSGLSWVLLIVAAVKAAVAIVPVVLNAAGWPARRFWRPLCWTGAAVLIAWGGAGMVVANLVLLGVIRSDDGYDRGAMIGHAWLWDPLFVAWGSCLAVGLWRSRRTPPGRLTRSPVHAADSWC